MAHNNLENNYETNIIMKRKCISEIKYVYLDIGTLKYCKKGHRKK